MDWLRKNWIGISGVVIVVWGWILFKPSDSSKGLQADASVGHLVAHGTPEPVEDEEGVEDDEDEDDQDEDTPVDRGSGERPASVNDPEFLMVEKVIAVPGQEQSEGVRDFKTGDPEVQRALSRVSVVLWSGPDCAQCDAARSFMTRSGVSFQTRDISDPNTKEKLRRLTKNSDVPVIQVDGTVVRHYSESALQSVIQDAVKNRVASGE